MELTFTRDDLASGNAHTAALLRALAGIIDPLATQTVDKLRANPETPIPSGVPFELRNLSVPPAAAAAEDRFGLDSAGMPWDERIHASSHATVADGTWKLKRGVDHELVAQLRSPTEGERLQAEQERDVPDPAKVGFGQQVLPPPPAAPTQDSAWPVDVLGAIPEGKTPFQVFMTWAMTKMSNRSLTQARLLEVINAHGIAQLPVLNAQPDKIPGIVRDLVGG